MRFSSLLLCVPFLGFIFACSSDPSTSSSNEGSPRGSANGEGGEEAKGGGGKPSTPSGGGGAEAKLSCLSHTFCTSADVASFGGQTLPEVKGGTIADGLYRLAYVLDTRGSSVQRGETVEAFVVRDGQALALTSFGTGHVGRLEVKGTTLTLTAESSCDSATGTVKDVEGRGRTASFTVDGDKVIVFGEEMKSAKVFQQADRICNLTKSVPATPGDSLTCNVSNCGCAEAVGAAADANTCKFVRGG